MGLYQIGYHDTRGNKLTVALNLYQVYYEDKSESRD